jgi:DNA-binding XRE family transcriptional regulator
MNMSARQLAAFVGVSPRTIGRLVQDGVLEREADGTFVLQKSVRQLFRYLNARHDWAFRQLRRFRMFDESTGDIFQETMSHEEYPSWLVASFS